MKARYRDGLRAPVCHIRAVRGVRLWSPLCGSEAWGAETELLRGPARKQTMQPAVERGQLVLLTTRPASSPRRPRRPERPHLRKEEGGVILLLRG